MPLNSGETSVWSMCWDVYRVCVNRKDHSTHVVHMVMDAYLSWIVRNACLLEMLWLIKIWFQTSLPTVKYVYMYFQGDQDCSSLIWSCARTSHKANCVLVLSVALSAFKFLAYEKSSSLFLKHHGFHFQVPLDSRFGLDWLCKRTYTY